MICPPGTGDGVVECAGWRKDVLVGGRGTRGSRRGRWGWIGRDSQAVVLRSSPGTPLEDLKQWRDL